MHFFGRDAFWLEASTDAAMSYGVFATGAAHSSGVGAGQTFWIYDNVMGDSGFNLSNAVDTGILLAPNEVYSLRLRIDPGNQIYAVQWVNLDTGAQFDSVAPHRFRDTSATAASHKILHFGVQARGAEDFRGFELDSVSISPAAGLVLPPEIGGFEPVNNAIHNAAAGLHFEVLSETSLLDPGIQLFLNGADVTAADGYQGVPILDGSGQPAKMTLAGVATGRLAACGPTSGLAVNFLLFAQVPDLPELIEIASPAVHGGLFTFSFTSQPGNTYVVEYQATLGNGTWVTLETVTATATTHQVEDPNPTDECRFYRVRKD